VTINPILTTIRELLKFKDSASVPEIAKLAGVTQMKALKVLNANERMVWRDRSKGRVTRVAPREILRQKLWEEGAYFHVNDYDYGATKGLAFNGHDEVRVKITQQTWGGGLGDSYKYSYVPDTEDNRRLLVKDGCQPFEQIVIDDRLWQED
jgi:hypothetical protein